MMAAARQEARRAFDVLQIDHRNDHNTRDTPRRVAKMFVEEMLRGRYTAPPRITEFDNVERCDQLIVTGPIEVRSTVRPSPDADLRRGHIGILPSPDGKIIGLSKYDRIVDYFASRLQIQEELVAQIGNYVDRDDRAARPRGAHQRGAHVQDPPRRARERTRAAWSTAPTTARCCATRRSRASSCRNAFRSKGARQ